MKLLPLLLILSFSSDLFAQNCPLKLAYQDRIVDALLVVALEQNMFANSGIDLQASVFKSGPACTEALLSGSADIATMGDAAGIILTTRQPGRFTILGSHGNGAARHGIVAQNKYKSLADLQGQKVAVKFGTSTHGGLLKLLAQKQWRWQLIDMEPSLQSTALASGEIAAMVASEPSPSIALERNIGSYLGNLDSLGNNYPVLLVSRQKWASQNQACLGQFNEVLQRAAQWVQANPAALVEIMARKNHLSPATARQALARHQYQLLPADSIAPALQTTTDFLRSRQIIE